jgi:eukaryotic-like serine/threonine-protein kinase
MAASSQDFHADSRDSRWRTVLLSGLCALGSWGCSAAPVRPPPGSRCPQEAWRVMSQELRMNEGSAIVIHLDLHQPGDQFQVGVYKEGPIVGQVVRESWSHPGLPAGTLLYGHLWTETGLKDEAGDRYAVVYYNRAVFPDGRERPVCIVSGNPNQGVLPFDDGSRPGHTLLRRRVEAAFVEYWPWGSGSRP